MFYSEPPSGVVWAPSFPVFPSYQGTLSLLADFTSDGIPDQISANAYDGVGVRPGRGDGTFADQIPFSFYAPNESLAGVADLNSDGKLDVFIASRRSDNVHTTFANVLAGAGDGSFVTYHFPIDYVTGGFTIPVAIGTGHLFGTGRTDLVIAGTNDYDALYVVLANTSAVGPTLPGDYNRNGTVDAADYVAWRHSPNDVGGDPGGYNLWRTNFSQTIDSDAALNADSQFAVPEPGGLALVTFTVPGLMRRRKDPRT
jgi:hypothetical protein